MFIHMVYSVCEKVDSIMNYRYNVREYLIYEINRSLYVSVKSWYNYEFTIMMCVNIWFI